MKNLYTFFLLFSCLGIVDGYSQLQLLTGNEIPGAIIVNTDNYDPQSIWSYNSSSAPVISEYGFTALLVQKIMIGTEDLKLEAYLMNTPEAAYGMYSTSILNCLASDSVTAFDCLTQYQYMSAYGRYYMVITSQSGSAQARQYSYTLMQKWMLLNPQAPLELPAVFKAPAFAGNRDRIVYVSGMESMQNSLLGWQNQIIGVRFSMYAVILPDPRGQIYFAQINFPTQGDMYTFLTNSRLMQNGVPVQAYNNYGFLFREFVPIDMANPLTIYFLQCTQPVAIAEITDQGGG